MRTAGTAAAIGPLGVHDHCCFVFDDPEEFRSGALEFLAEGLEYGLRVGYAGPGGRADLCAELEGLDGFESLLRSGAIVVSSLDEVYTTRRTVQPLAQVYTYAQSTAAALADGYAGFRVAVDATSLAAAPHRFDAFSRYEHLVDRYMAAHPFSALCAYRRDEVPATAVSQLACMHPLVVGGRVPFQLFAAGAGVLALRGEIDVACADLFDEVLGRVEPTGPGGELILEMSGLAFIDHRGVLALARHAARHGAPIALLGASRTVRHIVELLDVSNLLVEDAA